MPTLQRVLVIDDQPELRRMIDIMLTREGYIVVSVEGEDTISILENDQEFSLVITDLLMPKIDGFKVLRYLQQCCPTIPVIISSAEHNSSLVDQLLAQGAVAFLPRPFRPKELTDLVRNILNQ